jgi:hypothetical protein
MARAITEAFINRTTDVRASLFLRETLLLTRIYAVETVINLDWLH